MINNESMYVFVSDFRALLIVDNGVCKTSWEEKLMTDSSASEEEADVLLANIIRDLQPKNMVLIDKVMMARRRMFVKIIDSKNESPLTQRAERYDGSALKVDGIIYTCIQFFQYLPDLTY